MIPWACRRTIKASVSTQGREPPPISTPLNRSCLRHVPRIRACWPMNREFADASGDGVCLPAVPASSRRACRRAFRKRPTFDAESRRPAGFTVWTTPSGEQYSRANCLDGSASARIGRAICPVFNGGSFGSPAHQFIGTDTENLKEKFATITQAAHQGSAGGGRFVTVDLKQRVIAGGSPWWSGPRVRLWSSHARASWSTGRDHHPTAFTPLL